MFSQVQQVVVAIPGKEAAVAEFGGEFKWGVSFNPNRERATALVKACGIGDAVKLKPRHRCHSPDNAPRQAALTLRNCFICGGDCGATCGARWIGPPAQFIE